MPAYSYTAINQEGMKKKGILSAESEREARKLVKDLKLTPLKVSESKDLGKTLKIKDKDIATALQLPPIKLHCSVLAEETIQAAVKDWEEKHK